MKKIIFFVTVMLLSAVMFSCKKDSNNDEPTPPTPVVGDGIYLYGFSKDKTTSYTNIGNDKQGVKFDVATEFAGADLAAKATEIIGVRFYAGDGAQSGTAYVANVLGTRVVEQGFTVENAGWQYVIFDEPLAVTADLTYYVGYEGIGDGYFIGCDKVSGKAGVTHLLDGEVWKTFTDIGLTSYTLSLQAICQGGDYSGEKQHAYSVTDCSFPENVRAGEKFDFTVSVMSMGIKTAGTMSVKCVCGPDEFEAIINNARNGEPHVVTFNMGGVSASMTQVKITVSEEGVTETGSMTTKVNVYAADAPDRNRILVEEFTGQDCPNCPAGIENMRKAIAGMTNPEKAAWIAHHSGYYDDDFTLQGDLDIASAYGVQAAPQCMIDRMKVNYGDGKELVWHPGYATSAMLDNLAKIPADATMNLVVSFTEDSTIQVNVTGKSLKTEAYITVVLCQDSITARQSNGGNNFKHNEVVRAYLTAGKGDVLTLDDQGEYTFTATYTIPATISNYTSKKSFATDIQNMYVVAFIHGKSSSKGAVYNADKVELSGLPR